MEPYDSLVVATFRTGKLLYGPPARELMDECISKAKSMVPGFRVKDDAEKERLHLVPMCDEARAELHLRPNIDRSKDEVLFVGDDTSWEGTSVITVCAGNCVIADLFVQAVRAHIPCEAVALLEIHNLDKGDLREYTDPSTEEVREPAD